MKPTLILAGMLLFSSCSQRMIDSMNNQHTIEAYDMKKLRSMSKQKLIDTYKEKGYYRSGQWIAIKESEKAKKQILQVCREKGISDYDLGRKIRPYSPEKIRIGMTKSQVKELVGTPWAINTTETASAYREQWVYKRAVTGRKYIYFKNGVVVSMQR